MTIQFGLTSLPSTVIGYDQESEQFFHASTRTGAIFGAFQRQLTEAILADIVQEDKKVHSIDRTYTAMHHVKLRRIMVDDKNGAVTVYVDYLHDRGMEALYEAEALASLLGDGDVRHFGQGQTVIVSIKDENFSSDYFSPVANDYYSSSE